MVICFRNSALTRHKGGRNVECSGETVPTPDHVCDCGKYLYYRGIPTHRNKCEERIRKILLNDEDQTFRAEGPSLLTSSAETCNLVRDSQTGPGTSLMSSRISTSQVEPSSQPASLIRTRLRSYTSASSSAIVPSQPEQHPSGFVVPCQTDNPPSQASSSALSGTTEDSISPYECKFGCGKVGKSNCMGGSTMIGNNYGYTYVPFPNG